MACESPSVWITGVQVFAGMLAPIIGVGAWWIAHQQLKINRNKLKLDRFDKRFEIYEAAMSLVATIVTDDAVSDDRLREFNLKTRGARFMVSPEIDDYLNEIRRKAVELTSVKRQMQGPPTLSEEQREALGDRWLKAHEWFQKQVDTALPDRFARYLSVEDL